MDYVTINKVWKKKKPKKDVSMSHLWQLKTLYSTLTRLNSRFSPSHSSHFVASQRQLNPFGAESNLFLLPTVYIKILCTRFHTHLGFFFFFFKQLKHLCVAHGRICQSGTWKTKISVSDFLSSGQTTHFEHVLRVLGVFLKLVAFSKPVLGLLSQTIYLKKHSSILYGCIQTCHFPCLLILHAIMWAY